MDSIIASMNNNQDLEEKDIMEDQDIIEDSNKKSGGAQVSSFLKFSIQNILQHAAQASSNGSSSAAAAAAAVAAAASAAASVRRSTASDFMSQAEMAAAITDFDMKRAMGSLPFW